MKTLLSLSLVFRLATCSFYDNPPVDLPPDGGTPLEELRARWDADVSLFLSNNLQNSRNYVLRKAKIFLPSNKTSPSQEEYNYIENGDVY
jgi:hypothetical protein